MSKLPNIDEFEKQGVMKCAICKEPITDESMLFHREELCKIPIREEFKKYLISKGFMWKNIQQAYRKALIKYRNVGDSRQLTVEVYTRDNLTK